MIEFVEEILHHGLIDTIKMLPFLFAAFLLIESMEHYSENKIGKFFKYAGKTGPIIGAVAGCFPQCGFSVMAANLYAGGVITIGTLIATFIATSDEAILIIIGNPGHIREVLMLVFIKIIIGIVAGYVTNFCFRTNISVQEKRGVPGKECGCHDCNMGIMRHAIRHTVRIYLYILVFTVVLNLLIEFAGMERLSEMLLSNTILQPVIAAIIGFIPNCAASVVLTQLYLNGVISFASVTAGLCTGAGAGIIVLFKANENRKENLKIMGILFVTAAIAGILLEILSLF